MFQVKSILKRPSKVIVLKIALFAITLALIMTLTSVGAPPDPPPGGW